VLKIGHSTSTSAGVKNAWRYTMTSIRLHGVVRKKAQGQL